MISLLTMDMDKNKIKQKKATKIFIQVTGLLEVMYKTLNDPWGEWEKKIEDPGLKVWGSKMSRNFWMALASESL